MTKSCPLAINSLGLKSNVGNGINVGVSVGSPGTIIIIGVVVGISIGVAVGCGTVGEKVNLLVGVPEGDGSNMEGVVALAV